MLRLHFSVIMIAERMVDSEWSLRSGGIHKAVSRRPQSALIVGIQIGCLSSSNTSFAVRQKKKVNEMETTLPTVEGNPGHFGWLLAGVVLMFVAVFNAIVITATSHNIGMTQHGLIYGLIAVPGFAGWALIPIHLWSNRKAYFSR